MKTRYTAMFGIALGAMMLTACSQDNILIESEIEDSDAVSNTSIVKSFIMTDANGNEVKEYSSGYGEYYLNIDAEGDWKIETSDQFIHPAVTYGNGPQRVLVQIGNTWAEGREGSISVVPVGENNRKHAPKRASSSTNKVIIEQSASYNFGDLTTRLSPVVGCGYGYLYRGDSYSMNTTIPIFDISALNNKTTYMVSYQYNATDTYTSASSDSALQAKLAIKAGLSIKTASKLGIELSGKYKSASNDSTTRKYCQLSKNNEMYIVELNYNSLLADSTNHHFSIGFEMLRENFLNNIASATSNAAKTELCKDFCNIVGTHFVTKSCLGAKADYTISIQKSYLGDTLDIEALAKVTWQSKAVKSSDSSSSSDSKKASSNTGSSSGNTISGEATYTEAYTTVAEAVDAHLTLDGGDARLVNILATGGTLDAAQYQKWALSIGPNDAVMMDCIITPVYELFGTTDAKEKAARQALREFLAE